MKLNAEQIMALLAQAMPVTADIGMSVLNVSDDAATIRLPMQPWMLRPGNTISGPAMFTAADTASYVLVLATLGPTLLAVTTSANIHFLSKPQPTPLIARAQYLKQGRTLVITDVHIFNEIDGVRAEHPVAQMTCTYAIPAK